MCKKGEDEIENLTGSDEVSPIRRQIIAAAGVVMLTLGAGATSGYSAVLLPQLQEEGTPTELNKEMMSWIAAISCLPLFAGNVLAGYLMERFGRRTSLLMLAIPFISGWAIIGFSRSIYLILLGRFITGFCQGWLGPLGPVFIGEISTPKYRGFLLAALSLSIAVGIFASHLYGTYLHWKLAAILCGIFPAIAYLILLYVPESPSWLASKGRIEDCTLSFQWYRGNGKEAKTELTKMIMQYTEKTKDESQNFFTHLKSNLTKPEFRKPLLVMLVFFIITQLSGTNVICSYTATIMKPLISNNISEYTAMLFVDVLRCVTLTVACILLRRVGRRPLAIFSGSFTALSLIALATYLYLVRYGVVSDSSSTVTLSLISVYIIISNIGIVPLPWTMVGETFPAATRGLGSGISVMTTSVFFFGTVKTAPGLFNDIGQDGTFMLYGCATLLGTIYLYYYLPETKGKTLLQVEEIFKTDNKKSFKKDLEGMKVTIQGNNQVNSI